MINDFPTAAINNGNIIFTDGEYIKVPQIYHQKNISISNFYLSLLREDIIDNSPVFGNDSLGFSYVIFKTLCYIGILVEGGKNLNISKRLKLKYSDNVFKKSYIINHIQKELKFRNYEEFVPIDIVTKNIHELRNLNSKITSHIDEIIGVNDEQEWEKKFEEADENIKKIYVGTRLTKFILDNLKFYNPDYLETLKIDKSRSFVIHKSVLKIVKIFQNDFKKRTSEISLSGKSYKSIKGDKELFEIVLMLLIENALKYSLDVSAIPPKVNISESLDQQRVEIKISSWGNTIPENETDKIFSYGYRSKISSNIPGTGMGLYNAKKIVKLFNVSLKYTVDLGQKSVSNLGWNNFHLICSDLI